MNNEPVAIVKKITIGGIDNFPIEQFVRLKEGTLLYTHPVNPYQSITNTKIEPTVVSYTHPVKEQGNPVAWRSQAPDGYWSVYQSPVEGAEPLYTGFKELTDEEKLQFGMLFMNWNRSLKEPLVKPAYEQYVFEQAIAILRKAQEK